ncbi:MAG: DUF4350 domain-containing protein [Saprospiraceae bacterium]|nr:DUF4350 domain-containing protein [Saprospiraceae bacterium]
MALIAGVVFWMVRSGAVSSRRYTWVPNYQEKSAQPFGTQALFRLLNQYFPNNTLTTITDDLSLALPIDPDAPPAVYFFIGERPYYDSAATAHLLAFVAAGNTAFLCSERIPFDLMFYLYHEECPEAPWSNYLTLTADSLLISLKNPVESPTAAVYFANRNRVAAFNWAYLPSKHFCPPLPQTPLGYIGDSLVNFARFPCGEGAFYLHSTPLAFTNYHLLRPAMQRYVEAVLAHLPEGDIYWDVKYRDPEEMQRIQRTWGRRPPSEHPLKHLLQQPSLAWAWYLMLALAGLYVLFRSKRRQRVVPLWPRKENTSFEYVDAIAQMHFRQRNYRYLCVQMIKTFLLQTRERFGIAPPSHIETLQTIPEDFVQRLSEAAKVPAGDVRIIFSNYAAALIYDPIEQNVLVLRSNIRHFWALAEGR